MPAIFFFLFYHGYQYAIVPTYVREKASYA